MGFKNGIPIHPHGSELQTVKVSPTMANPAV